MFKIKELADLLQLNQQTVRNMVNRGELEWTCPVSATLERFRW